MQSRRGEERNASVEQIYSTRINNKQCNRKKGQQHYLSSNLTEFCNDELMKFVEFARKNIAIDGFKLRAARGRAKDVN